MTTREMHQKFWAQFNEYASHNQDFIREFKLSEWQSHTDRHAYDFHIGECGYHLVITLNTPENRINVGIYCDSLATYKEVYAIKPQIEKDLGFELSWHQSDDRGNAYLRRIVDVICDESTWPELNEWSMKYLMLFKKTCKKYYPSMEAEQISNKRINTKTMNYWIIPSNEEKFRLSDCLKENNVVDWRQRNNFEVGDIVFIYNSKPHHRITHEMIVERINVPSSEYLNDRKFWADTKDCEEGLRKNRFVRLQLIAEAPSTEKMEYETLRKNGLKSNLQSTINITDTQLLYYIQPLFDSIDPSPSTPSLPTFIDNNFESIQDPNNLIPEGAKTQITVNRYERNPEAREQCLKAKGYTCSVCGMNFEEVYGPIGKDYIHVHHIVPISEIGQSYEVNPVTDLVPVCPNCHAMLHHGKDGKVLTVEELKEILKENKKSAGFFGFFKLQNNQSKKYK